MSLFSKSVSDDESRDTSAARMIDKAWRKVTRTQIAFTISTVKKGGLVAVEKVPRTFLILIFFPLSEDRV